MLLFFFKIFSPFFLFFSCQFSEGMRGVRVLHQLYCFYPLPKSKVRKTFNHFETTQVIMFCSPDGNTFYLIILLIFHSHNHYDRAWIEELSFDKCLHCNPKL